VRADDGAAAVASSGPEVDQPVRSIDDVELCSITTTVLPWSRNGAGREGQVDVVEVQSVVGSSWMKSFFGVALGELQRELPRLRLATRGVVALWRGARSLATSCGLCFLAIAGTAEKSSSAASTVMSSTRRCSGPG